jgi:hypothetical protein
MKISCLVAPDVDLYFVGRVLAGVFEQPDASVRVRIVPWIKKTSVGLEVNHTRFGIELSDHQTYLDMGLYEWCDIYAKRSLNLEHLPRLSKAVPFAPHCAGNSKESISRVLAALAYASPRSFSLRWRSIYKYLAAPHWKDFELSPAEAISDTILFQTRLWNPVETPGDAVVNEERINLLLALKGQFGDRFVGGIVPNAYAKDNYPELISPHPARQSDYIRWAKSSAIGIYSRGLFGSVAFKMAEFLASSKCIISEPIDNALPGPTEYLSVYRSTEEMHCAMRQTPHLSQDCAGRQKGSLGLLQGIRETGYVYCAFDSDRILEVHWRRCKEK